MSEGVTKTLRPSTVRAKTVVAGILSENYREQKCMEKITGGTISHPGGETFSVSCGSLAESGIDILRLLNTGIESIGHEVYRLYGVAHEQMKFPLRIERANGLTGFPMPWSMHRFDFWFAREIPDHLFQRPVIFLHREQRRRFNAGVGCVRNSGWILR